MAQRAKPQLLSMSLLYPQNEHHLGTTYTTEFSCQHEVQPSLRLEQFLHSDFEETLPKTASQWCWSLLNHSHSWPAFIFPAKQKFYFRVTSLLLITANFFSDPANQITQTLNPHDLLKSLFSSEIPQASHLLSALLPTFLFLSSSYRIAHWALNCHWFPSPKLQSFSTVLSKTMWSGLHSNAPLFCYQLIFGLLFLWWKDDRKRVWRKGSNWLAFILHNPSLKETRTRIQTR